MNLVEQEKYLCKNENKKLAFLCRKPIIKSPIYLLPCPLPESLVEVLDVFYKNIGGYFYFFRNREKIISHNC